MNEDRSKTVLYWRRLGMSTRAANGFANYEITTKVKLALVPDFELLRLPNFGRKSLKEVRAIVPHRRPKGPREMRIFKRTMKELQKRLWQTPMAPAFVLPQVNILRHPGDPLSTSETGTTYHSGIYWPKHG